MIFGYSLIIPVYNSESTLEPLCKRLVKVLEDITENYEIILINDGSSDRSSIIMEKINKINSNFKIINLMRNYGQHNALLCGMRIANYNMTITIDDDLQYHPEEIPKLIEKLNEGYDVVYGYPKKLNHGFYRNIASMLTKIILKTSMGVQTARYVSSFRLFKTDLCRAFGDYKGPFVSIDVLLSWGTNSFSSIVVYNVVAFRSTPCSARHFSSRSPCVCSVSSAVVASCSTPESARVKTYRSAGAHILSSFVFKLLGIHIVWIKARISSFSS